MFGPSRHFALPRVFQNGKDCHSRSVDEICEFLVPNAKRTIINLGDSHADIVGTQLLEWSKKNNYSYIHMTNTSCPFVLDAFRFNDQKILTTCTPKTQRQWLKKIKSYDKPVIIYSGRFPLYLSGHFFDNGLGGVEIGPDYKLSATNDPKSNKAIAPLIINTINQLIEISSNLILIYPIPEAGWHVPNVIRRKLLAFPISSRSDKFKLIQLTTPYSVYKIRAKSTYEIFDSLSSNKIIRVYPGEIFCSEKTNSCITTDSSKIFYSDTNHLSMYGANLVANAVTREFELNANIDSPTQTIN